MKTACIYPVLSLEMLKKGISKMTLAADPRLDWTIAQAGRKLSGKTEIRFGEAAAIREILGTQIPMEALFRRA